MLRTPYTIHYTLYIILDITSHWFHVMSVTAHHKSKEALAHRNPLLQWYYSIYPLFGYCCVGTECFYILLYVLHFIKHPALEMVSVCVCYYHHKYFTHHIPDLALIDIVLYASYTIHLTLFTMHHLPSRFATTFACLLAC
ncbi:hypothetical protein EON63_09465 [archaeon]|nr:MAG: hypothetical protein EON63_09465 [archaeon]